MVKTYLNVLLAIFLFQFLNPLAYGQESPVIIKKTIDFEIDGKGSNENWNITDWMFLEQRNGPNANKKTMAKMLYSDTGLYFLYHNEDSLISASFTEDFAHLWEEDVVEVFLWTDVDYPYYFEYELSPLNYELPILVPNVKGKFHGWLPWQYEGDRKTQHKTFVQKSRGQVKAWMAEFFIPYALMNPMSKVPAKPGMVWRMNMYRLDYDQSVSAWSWKSFNRNFHDYEGFGEIQFE